jgi:hypothetical protein
MRETARCKGKLGGLWCSIEYIGDVYFPHPSKSIRADSSTVRFTRPRFLMFSGGMGILRRIGKALSQEPSYLRNASDRIDLCQKH